jgi:DNA-binding MurR/RpiR family transcriptional regulator
MMKQDNPLLNQLRDYSANYSRRQRVLAKWILTHYQRVAFATIKELADLAGVSESTIVRFAKVLGFTGYPAFQKEIRRILRSDLKGNERFRLAYESQRRSTNPLSKIIKKEIENIGYLHDNFDEKVFRKTLSAIKHASEIVVVGTRSSAPLAYHLWFGLTKLEIRVKRVLAITTETYDEINRLDRRALIIVIGFPRYLRELLDILSFAKKRGIKTITITDSPFSSLLGDLSLFSPAESTSFMAFHCAPLVLINALIQGLSLIHTERTSKALNRFEILAEARDYFTKG